MNRREAVAAALAQLAPRLPAFESEAVTDRALASPGLRNARPDNAAWLALVAYARHVFTEYDDLLAALPPHRRDAPEVVAVRWLIEELRISLFAQDLRTPVPVSAVRLFRAMDALR